MARLRYSSHSVPADSVYEVCDELRLGEILIGRGVITYRLLQRALSLQVRSELSLGEILISEKVISHLELAQALQEQYWRRQGLGWNKKLLSSLWQSAT